MRPRPIVPQPRGRDLVLSHQQERLWVLHQLEPDRPANRLDVTYRLRGRLDAEALRRAFEQVIRRHEVLRTVFPDDLGVPRQRILEAGRWELPIEDLRALEDRAREGRCQQIIEEAALRPFDLAAGPLVRTALIRLADEEHVLFLTMHHIVYDGWSVGVFWKELTGLYEAELRGDDARLPELAVQYADYAAWQREALDHEDRDLSSWKARLGGAPESSELPFKKSRSSGMLKNRGASVVLGLDAQLSNRLRALGASQGATLPMTMLAALRALLFRYTGQQDLCIGTVIADRAREVRDLIGVFANTLVLRNQVDSDISFADLLAREKSITFEAYKHRATPLEVVLRALNLKRTPDRNPLFQILFVHQPPALERDFAGIAVETTWPVLPTATPFELELEILEIGEALQASFVYDATVFDRSVVEQMARHYLRLMMEALEHPTRAIGRFALLDARDRERLLIDWACGAQQPTGDALVHDLVAARAAETPDAPAIASIAGSITFRELDGRANQLAHALQARGVGPDQLVGLFLTRSIESVVSALATLKAGGAYVPIDPADPASRVEDILTRSRPVVVVTSRPLAAALPAHLATSVVLVDDATVFARIPSTPPRCKAGPDNTAYVIHTSGSTGRPKGVAVPHRAFRNVISWNNRALEVGADDRVTQLHSMSFDAAVLEIWAPLAAGARVHIVDDDLRLDPPRLLESFARWGITITDLPSRLLDAVLDEGNPPACLRVLRTGGDRLVRRPSPGAHYRLLNEYGPTENAVDATWATVAPAADAGSELMPAIGRPIDNVQVYVLDARLEPVSIHVVGELYVGGDNLARGYVGDAALTASRFVPNPYGERGTRLYRTGDLARWLPDGNLDFVGRVDHQVKIRGFRIELEEVEAALIEHPEVKAAVVVVREDRDGNKRLVAYWVPRLESVAPRYLRAFSRQRLPEYMVPALFVELAELPRTATGKIDRKALPAPPDDLPERSDYEPPRDPLEEQLAGIWSRLLRVKRVGRSDSFFDLGGDSIVAIQMVAQARERGLHLNAQDVFQHNTVAALALVVVNTQVTNAGGGERGVLLTTPIQPRPEATTAPVSFSREFRFLQFRHDRSDFDNVLDALTLIGDLDTAAFEAALNDVIHRHASLRATIRHDEGRLVQIIRKPDEVPYMQLPVEQAPGSQAEIVALAQAEFARAFDSERELPLRCRLLRKSRTEHIVILTIDHVCTDATGLAVLWNDLERCYVARKQAAIPRLPELAFQAQDVEVWQRQLVFGPDGAKQIAYWRTKLRGCLPCLLPTDHPRPQGDAGAALRAVACSLVSVSIPKAKASSVFELARENKASVYAVLLAHLGPVLGRWLGQDEVSVLSTYHHRDRPGTEQLVSLLGNSLLMRLELSGSPSRSELIARAMSTTFEAFSNAFAPVLSLPREQQDLPFREPLAPMDAFRINFNYLLDKAPTASRFADLEREQLPILPTKSRFDLIVIVHGTPEDLRISGMYNSDLFRRETIERLLAEYVQAIS